MCDTPNYRTKEVKRLNAIFPNRNKTQTESFRKPSESPHLNYMFIIFRRKKIPLVGAVSCEVATIQAGVLRENRKTLQVETSLFFGNLGSSGVQSGFLLAL